MSRGYEDVGAALGFGRVLPLGFARLRVELLAGYEHLFQDPWQGEARHTSGFAYLGLVGIELPLGGLRFGLEVGSGGRVFQVIGEGWVHRVDFQAALYAAWGWEVRRRAARARPGVRPRRGRGPDPDPDAGRHGHRHERRRRGRGAGRRRGRGRRADLLRHPDRRL